MRNVNIFLDKISKSPQQAHMSQFYSSKTATLLIIANMVGSGVFTSLGFQLVDIRSGFVILLLWVLGGIAALTGAATYAELGAALPRSGGEYNFLGRIYHPMAGFISGWISATIGFAAPTAAVAIGFGAYTVQVIPGLSDIWEKPLALLLIAVVTLAHIRNRKGSETFQFASTLIKIVLILAFCIAALRIVPAPQEISFIPQSGDEKAVLTSGFGVALIYVIYSYTGWNAATYISGELENPQRDLPKILIIGTGFVLLLYVLLNYVFLTVAPVDAMVGKVEIGFIVAQHAFGDIGGRIAGGMLALLFISSVSAMTLAGPRAIHAIGEDFNALSFLAKTSRDGIPYVAITLQSLITVALIITSTFEQILVFAGAMLAFNSLLAVLGVFVLRWKEPDLPRPYKTWGYPVTPIIFTLITLVTLIYVVQEKPLEALFGMGIIVAGALFYLATKNR